MRDNLDEVRGGHQPRILVVGMQSSGSTLTTLLLAQTDDTIGLLDLRCGALMPAAETFPTDRQVVAKATISVEFELADHQRAFEPDRTVLVIRHPSQIHSSLARKPYAAMGGPIERKFAILEELFVHRDRFDAVVTYEDVVLDPDAALAALRRVQPSLTLDAWNLDRHARTVVADARRLPSLQTSYGELWGSGNFSPPSIDRHRVFSRTSKASRDFARAHCPRTLQWCDEQYRTEYPQWRRLAMTSQLQGAGLHVARGLRYRARRVQAQLSR